jgi:hypothetical protein
MSAKTASKPLPVLDINRPESAKAIGTELATTTSALATRLGPTVVNDLVSCEQAVLDRQTIGAAIKNIEAFFEPFVSMAFQLHRALTGRRAEILAPLLKLDIIKRGAIQQFNTEQTRLRQAREREIADQRRREEQDRAAAEAAHLEHEGEHELAAAVIEEAIAAPAPVVALKNEVAALATFVEQWHWRYTGGPKNVDETPAAVIARSMQLIPREFLCVDEKKVGAYAGAMKQSGVIPGIEIYSEQVPRR